LGLTVFVDSGLRDAEHLVESIQTNGGVVVANISKAITFVLAVDEDADCVEEAKELGVPGVEKDFIAECLEKGTHWEDHEMSSSLVWGEARSRKRGPEETQSAKFVEKRGVRMDQDVGELKDKAHVLVDTAAKQVYSEMLSKTDLVTGANSFYTLHLLESDDSSSSEYWVFRKWGRIGVSQGGTKIEEFGSNKAKAIKTFCKLYIDKTGNQFGHVCDEFQDKPGLFTRLDVEHSVLSKKAKMGDDQSSVDGSSDQPMGKLTKVQIEKGDKVLDGIEAILAQAVEGKLSQGQSMQLLGLSAQYYSLIPHNFGVKKPPPINTQDLLGAEKALLQFYLRMGFEEMDNAESVLTPISGVMQLELPPTLMEASKAICKPKDVTSCLKKGEKFAKKKAGKPVGEMNSDLYGSILLYTSNAIYKDLNKALRDEHRAKVQNYFPYLRMLFEACARLPTKTVTLWRGVSVDLFSSYAVGSEIIWWGVSSCTSNEKVARDFMNGCGDGASLLEVETETACDIAQVSFYANEAESLLLPGTRLRVLHSEKKGNKAFIKLKEVGREVS